MGRCGPRELKAPQRPQVATSSVKLTIANLRSKRAVDWFRLRYEPSRSSVLHKKAIHL